MKVTVRPMPASVYKAQTDALSRSMGCCSRVSLGKSAARPVAATGKCHPGGEVLWRRDVPRSLHPESAGTGSGRCRRRQAVARGRPAFPSARTPPGSSGGRSSGRYAGFAGLKVCTELPDSFFRMKGYAGAGWGLIQGGRVAGEPPGKPSGKPSGNRKTAGKLLAKPPGDHWQNCRKTAGKPPGKAPFLGNFCQSQ